jgi:hypothetical protein
MVQSSGLIESLRSSHYKKANHAEGQHRRQKAHFMSDCDPTGRILLLKPDT